MPRVVTVRPLNDYRLEIRFEDGTAGIISLADQLFGPMFEPLRDWQMFCQVTIDPYGAVCWPNGADLAPDALYQRIRTPSDTARTA